MELSAKERESLNKSLMGALNEGCPNCDADVEDDEDYCPKCGAHQ